MEENFTLEDLKDQRSVIGEFVIRFENLNDWMSFIMPFILFRDHPSESQVRNTSTMTSGLGAEQLKAKFDSLIIDNFRDYPGFIKANKTLSNKTSNLFSIRNSIVHGSYRLGWKNFDGDLNNGTFSLRHSKTTSKGFEKRSKILNVKEIEAINRQLINLSNIYTSIIIIVKNILIYNEIEIGNHWINHFRRQVDSFNKIELKHLDILN